MEFLQKRAQLPQAGFAKNYLIVDGAFIGHNANALAQVFNLLQ